MLEFGKAIKLMLAGLADWFPNFTLSVSGVDVMPAVWITDLDCVYSTEASCVVVEYCGMLPAETH